MAEISRRLTAGELHQSIEIFGASINYNIVVIHNTTAYFFQPDDTAITPNGEVYFPPRSYKPDFSTNVDDASWLIHEMTHVWQYQQGMWVRLRGAINRSYRYGDLSKIIMTLVAFGIEQQASIVTDYFRLKHGAQPTRGTGSLADYERIIPFLPRRG